MEYQAISWDARDDPDTSKYTVTIFGRSENGEAVSVRTHFQPYFFAQTQAPRQIHEAFDFIKAKTLWGFTNNEPQTFVRFQCDTHEEMRRLVWRCRNKKVGIFEANVDPLLRFMHRTGVQSTGWFKVEGGGVPDGPGRIFVENWKHILPVERDDIAPLRVMSLDIETYSSTGSFPDAEVKDDVLFQIAMTMNTGERKCFSLGECHQSDTECCESEKDLLEKWSRYIVQSDPDVITGWNIFGFDLEYIYKRMVVSKCHPDTFCFGKDPDIPCELKVKELSSGALGSNVLKMVPMVGRYVFDLFHVVKAEHKLESYSLNNVSKHFLGDTKNDMPIHEMFAMYRDRKDLTRVAEYCLKDTELPLRLMEKLCTIENLIEMAKATWVPLNFLSERGQQIKVFSQFVKKARELKFMVPTFFDKPPDTGKYEGATVLDAQCGAYYTPITALDFASLYPSIMMAHNLCYSTLVMDKKYANIPGVTYETHGEHTFAQDVPSLLPEILKDLKLFRKKAKGDMKKFPHLYNVYNGKQLAYKISMNSVYGFTGAARGMLPCVPIASTVTLVGRGMIQKSKEYVEEHFPGAKVRYGDTDSIMVEFDVGDRTGQDAINYSWELGERASKEITGIFKAPNELELEKVYCPYFLYSKKRYAAKKWEGPIPCTFKEVDIKGLQVIRRDNCQFVRDVCQTLIDMILESSNPEKPLTFINEKREELMSGRVPMEKLILSKRLGDSYKNNNLAHVAVRDKMKQRAPGSEPQSGDRVQFVILTHPEKRAQMFKKSESYEYARDNGLPLDYQYYLKHQFENPVKDLLEPLVG
jgi:DNA polymerase delta subunit 1